MSKFLSPEMKKTLAKPWLWVTAIVVSAGIWTLVFYWASRPPIEKKFNLWVGAPFELNDELKSKIEDVCFSAGMKENYINSYDPSDHSYAIAFSMQAASTDVFILHKDEALAEAEAEVFRSLPDKYKGDNSLEYVYKTDGGEAVAKMIGVKFVGEYYVFIGSKSVKSNSLLYSVVDLLVEYGLAAEDGTQ